MSQHLWAIIKRERHSIWVDWIIHAQLQDKSIWTITECTGSWGWRKLLKYRTVLLPNIQYCVRDSGQFSLWHDLGPRILHFSWGLQLTRISSSNTLSTVIEYGGWRWPLITDIAYLEIVHLLPPIHNGMDRILWKFNGGLFSNSSAYYFFRPPGTKVSNGWFSLLLGPFKISKNCFILWLAILGKLSTSDKPRLLHLGGGCMLCTEGHTETHDHLFFTCSFSRQCMVRIRERVKFPWPHTSWQPNSKWASTRWRGNHVVNAAYRALLASLVYHIWQERNRHRFHNTSCPSSIVGSIIIDEITQRILSDTLRPSISTRALYQLWPWPVDGC
ncbi:UNVERIFIED_CONTAM: hypothetical protein Sradi_4443600 [Sesamum radiatum]|uniref:Reverse transcriptase zinc-binding domain-containing protein n=1 Tax=Sesamum radiatum TaxID=300843 RepID=A0AAW2NRW3_SESRA